MLVITTYQAVQEARHGRGTAVALRRMVPALTVCR
jgi:hypothetical protein